MRLRRSTALEEGPMNRPQAWQPVVSYPPVRLCVTVLVSCVTYGSASFPSTLLRRRAFTRRRFSVGRVGLELMRQTERRANRDTSQITRNTKNNTFAIPAAAPAMPAKPSKAAINAMNRNTSVQ